MTPDTSAADARRLRRDGWSVNDIAVELGVARSTAWRWVRDLPLDPDSERAKAKRAHAKAMTDGRWARHRAERDAQRAATIARTVDEIGALTDREVQLIGAAIYWCEGTKSKPWSPTERITLTNSDPGIIALFLRFLELNGVTPGRIRYRVSIHESSDAIAAACWWAERLDVPLPSFHRPTLKRHRPLTVRRNVDDGYHGCLVVTVAAGRQLYWRILGLMTACVEAVVRRSAGAA